MPYLKTVPKTSVVVIALWETFVGQTDRNNIPFLRWNRTLFLIQWSMIFGAFVLPTNPTLAHPVSLSAAIIDVHEDHIAVEIQIMLEDLVLYQEVSADSEYRYPADALREAARKHGDFVTKYFTIRDANGEQLVGNLQEIDTSTIDENGVPQTDLMNKWVTYPLVVPVDSRQNFFTFMQTFGGRAAVIPAVMDLMLLQSGILLETPTQLTLGQPHSVKFDWDNPPAHAPNSLRELRKMRDEQLRERLGIATYGGLYSFLYIHRFEVRHEILVPLLTLETWLSIPREDPDFLEVAEQEVVRTQIGDFFQESNLVSINGLSIPPNLVRINFFGLDINDFALNKEPRRVSVYQARVGVILSYPSRSTLQDVELHWKTFSEHAPFLRSIVLAGHDDPFEHIFFVKRPRFRWHSEWIDTPVKPVLVQSQTLNTVTSTGVLQKLLSNVYSAFDFRDDSDVYDTLATSVQGDLLRDLYLKIKRSLLVAEQGGAQSHVTTVKILSVKPTRNFLASEYEVTWRTTGTVEHWGHVHTRINEYDATFTLETEDGVWKLSKVDILGEKRVQFKTKIRGKSR